MGDAEDGAEVERLAALGALQQPRLFGQRVWHYSLGRTHASSYRLLLVRWPRHQQRALPQPAVVNQRVVRCVHNCMYAVEVLCLSVAKLIVLDRLTEHVVRGM